MVVTIIASVTFDALAKFQIPVVRARQDRTDDPGRLQLARQFGGGSKRDVFFLCLRFADGAGILAAVAGIDEHRPFRAK